jgi:hypothetical protein
MKVITHYAPPTPHDLEALKESLQQTGRGMASLAALAGDNQWRKYTGGKQPRAVSVQMAFFIAARLELDEAQLEKVYARMSKIGCDLELGEALGITQPA